MSTSQPSTSHTSKQQSVPVSMGCFGILFVATSLFYYGYCWGFWGRNSLLLQYLFQCSCPVLSEDWRYPSDVDVVVSACSNEGMMLSPSGRSLLVHGREAAGYVTATLLNLQTGDTESLTLPAGKSYLLTDSLFYIFAHYGYHHEGGDHILDLSSNTMYPIQRFMRWRPGSFINGYADPIKLAESLHSAERVYYIRSERLIVALPQDIARIPDQGFLSSAFDLPYDGDLNRAEAFLQENNIGYEYISESYPGEVISPDGRFIARDDGIYLAETDQMIAKAPISTVKGWVFDGRGAIYTWNRCLFLLSLPGLDMACLIQVRQPVLLLEVPEE